MNPPPLLHAVPCSIVDFLQQVLQSTRPSVSMSSVISAGPLVHASGSSISQHVDCRRVASQLMTGAVSLLYLYNSVDQAAQNTALYWLAILKI